MKICNEMIKLRRLLDENNIIWCDKSTIVSEKKINEMMLITPNVEARYFDTSMYRTHFVHNGINYSVINGYGSYGGYNLTTGENEGFLEMLSNDEEVVGYLTADKVMSLVLSGNKSVDCVEPNTSDVRLIDANKIKVAIEKICAKYNITYGDGCGGFADAIANVVDSQPTVNVNNV